MRARIGLRNILVRTCMHIYAKITILYIGSLPPPPPSTGWLFGSDTSSVAPNGIDSDSDDQPSCPPLYNYESCASIYSHIPTCFVSCMEVAYKHATAMRHSTRTRPPPLRMHNLVLVKVLHIVHHTHKQEQNLERRKRGHVIHTHAGLGSG